MNGPLLHRSVGKRLEMKASVSRTWRCFLMGISSVLCGQIRTVHCTNPRSKDAGKTWSQPASVGWPGVKPKLRVLERGVLACTSGRGRYGRPQVTYAVFSIDGTGDVWEAPFSFYTGLGDNYTFTMEREGKLYVVYSVLSAANPPIHFLHASVRVD